MLSPPLGVVRLLLIPCAGLRSIKGDSSFQMATSPDVSGSSRPAELKLSAAPLTWPSEEDGSGKLASSPRAEEDECGGGECHTPTSKESKIPAFATCPPAPRKLRRMLPARKRRLADVELFRVGPELMCRLFRPLDTPSFVCLPPLPGTKKRKLHYQDHE